MSAPAQPRAGFGRVVGASIIGTTVEWYDFFLYGSAAGLGFPHLFFPEQSDFAGTLLSFGTYAVGFAARPVGALVFGPLRRPLRGGADRPARLRPLRRPHRTQEAAGHLAVDDGRVDLRHRTVADLR